MGSWSRGVVVGWVSTEGANGCEAGNAIVQYRSIVVEPCSRVFRGVNGKHREREMEKAGEGGRRREEKSSTRQ